MRGMFVGIVGAVAILGSAFGLALDGLRAGPFDRPLEPVVVQGHAEGTYHARPAASGPLGVCVQPPCEAATDIELTFTGLPMVPYELRLQGAAGSEPLGTHRPSNGTFVLRWSQQQDHGDKDRLVLAVAGRDVTSLPVRGSTDPLQVASPLAAAWGGPPGDLHINEIGGATISSVATATLGVAPPEGWEFRARFEGPHGAVDFGAFEVRGDDSVLDGRVERLRLEDHERCVVLLAPLEAGPDDGFPFLEADLWP